MVYAPSGNESFHHLFPADQDADARAAVTLNVRTKSTEYPEPDLIHYREYYRLEEVGSPKVERVVAGYDRSLEEA